VASLRRDCARGEVIRSWGGVWSALVPTRSRLRYEVGLLASVTLRVVTGVRATGRSSEATFWLKSEGAAAACVPFTSIQAEETRWVPLGSPFWMCSVKGETTQAGTLTVVV
jgi:hypothetical protein